MASLRFLGNWSSNITASKRNISLLLDGSIAMDFGPHSIESLLEMGVDPCGIDTIFISHMHLDHYAGLPELLWYRAIHQCREPVHIVGPKGIGNNTKSLLELLHTPDAFEIFAEYHEEKYDNATGFPANHLIRDIGFRLELGGKVVFYSGDTSYSENVSKGAEKADILLHEMTYLDSDRQWADFWKHSTVSDALRVFSESGSKLLVPVHLTSKTESYLNGTMTRDSRIRAPQGHIDL